MHFENLMNLFVHFENQVRQMLAEEGSTAIDFPPLVLHLVVQVDFLDLLCNHIFDHFDNFIKRAYMKIYSKHCQRHNGPRKLSPKLELSQKAKTNANYNLAL